MGPPRTIKPARPPSRSRFQEGSMNDRTSAVPPVQFIGAEERLLLFQQQQQKDRDVAIDIAKVPSTTVRAVPADDKSTAAAAQSAPPQVNKRGSKQFLGQMFGGFMEKLRGKRDAASSAGGGSEEEGQRKRKKSSKDQSPGGSSSGSNSNRNSRTEGNEILESYDQLVAAGFFSSPSVAQPVTSFQTASATGMLAGAGASTARPSREEIMESYQRLVASGFFASHAIQSTRQPAPGGVSSRRSSTAVQRPGSQQAAGAAPQWPLAGASALEPPTALTPSKVNPSPIRSPGSASSRGTKRAAVTAEDEDRENGNGRTSGDSTEGGHRAMYSQQAKKKLRKTASASRDLAMPKLRSASSSRRALLSRRSFSNAFAQSQAATAAATPATAAATEAQAPSASVQPPPSQQQPPRESGRLTKRVLGKLQVPDRVSSSSVAPANSRRNVSESHHNPLLPPSSAEPSQRVLRSRRSAAEPLRAIRPNASRGVPAVPDVPAKFTFGTDRENDGPWRGLRRANDGVQQ